MDKLNYNDLSAEQKAEFRRQLEAEEREKKQERKKLESDYADLKSDQVNSTFERLSEVSQMLEKVKIEIFNEFGAVLGMKAELFLLTPEDMELQQSHTFTNAENTRKIIIGSNVIDRWGDEVKIGIERVNKWIDAKITDQQSREIIRALLKPNADGELKAGRVLDLSKKANEFGDNELIDAVNFIRDQYLPEKTSTYVKVKYKDDDGIWQWLPLAMSAV